MFLPISPTPGPKHDLDGIAEAFRLAAALPCALFLALHVLRFRRGRVLRFSRRGFVSAAVLYRGVRIAAVVPVSAVASRIFPARVIVFGARGARMNGTLVPPFPQDAPAAVCSDSARRRPAVFPPRRRYCLKTSRNSAWRRASFFPAVGSFDLDSFMKLLSKSRFLKRTKEKLNEKISLVYTKSSSV